MNDNVLVACKYDNSYNFIINIHNIFIKNEYNQSLLYVACKYDSIKCVKTIIDFMIKNDISINNLLSKYFSPLHIACTLNNNNCINQLLRIKKININRNNFYDGTPLFISCRSGKYKCVKLLISIGANVNMLNYRLISPFHVAFQKNKKKCMNLLLDKIDLNYELRIAHIVKNLLFNDSYKKILIKKYNKYIYFIQNIITKKLVLNFLCVINSNTCNSPLTCFFSKNKGLRKYIGKKISLNLF